MTRRAANGCSGAGAGDQDRCDRGRDLETLRWRRDIECDRRRSRRSNSPPIARGSKRMCGPCSTNSPPSEWWIYERASTFVGNHGETHRGAGRLLAELTYRCPLACPYCSNPLEARRARRRTRYADLEAGLFRGGRARRSACASFRRRTGGAARSRRDRRPLRQGRPLYQSHHLRASVSRAIACSELADAGLDHVQLSIQDVGGRVRRPYRRL